jgi:D-glycero-D-manno-heptose 1,7-bisphosphate phosphatase
MTEADLRAIHSRMQDELIKLMGFCFDDIFYCTDLAETNSHRRKPSPGMLLEAIELWKIEPRLSWMVGDNPSDAAAGKAAGVSTILIGNWDRKDLPEADYIFTSLYEAKEFFLNNIDKH